MVYIQTDRWTDGQTDIHTSQINSSIIRTPLFDGI